MDLRVGWRWTWWRLCMVHVIVGENASGKTVALHEVLEQYDLKDV